MLSRLLKDILKKRAQRQRESAFNAANLELRRAISTNDPDRARSALNAGADPNFKTDRYSPSFTPLGLIALHRFSGLNQLQIVHLLSDYGADFNLPIAPGDSRTPLNLAFQLKDETLALLMIRYGADLYRKDPSGKRVADYTESYDAEHQSLYHRLASAYEGAQIARHAGITLKTGTDQRADDLGL